MPLLDAAGIADKIDGGIMKIEAQKDAKTFVEQYKKLRYWDRVSANAG
ncbi:MAG: hypothetical protein V7676_14365 [Parasphingorhabdus sp.]